MTLVQSKTEESTEGAFYLAKDKHTKWSKKKLASRIRTRAHNIVSQTPGVLGKAKNAKFVLVCWEIFFPDDVIDIILKNMNDEIERKQENDAKNK